MILLIVALAVLIGTIPYIYDAGYQRGYRAGCATNPFVILSRSVSRLRPSILKIAEYLHVEDPYV